LQGPLRRDIDVDVNVSVRHPKRLRM
jgi:hypothetical protein